MARKRKGKAHDLPVPQKRVTRASAASAPRTDPITAKNAAESPLLRLPAELRVRIWEIAFGEKFVHVINRGRAPHLSLFEYQFVSPHKFDVWSVLDEPEALPISCHEKCCAAFPSNVSLVPPVCKQMYAEASTAFWETTTFSFHSGTSLGRFVSAPGAQINLHLVRQLVLHIHWKGWFMFTKFDAIPQFKGLRGLELTVYGLSGSWREYKPPLPVLSQSGFVNPIPAFSTLPKLIEEFRELPLGPESTTVLVPDIYGVPKNMDWAEQIRDALLQEGPFPRAPPKPPRPKYQMASAWKERLRACTRKSKPRAGKSKAWKGRQRSCS